MWLCNFKQTAGLSTQCVFACVRVRTRHSTQQQGNQQQLRPLLPEAGCSLIPDYGFGFLHTRTQGRPAQTSAWVSAHPHEGVLHECVHLEGIHGTLALAGP